MNKLEPQTNHKPARRLTPEEVAALRNCRRLPGRLSLEEVAALLGFEIYELLLLVRLGLLRPLGKPAPNGHKYFCATEIEALARNRDFLDRASRAVAKVVQDNNRKAARNFEDSVAA